MAEQGKGMTGPILVVLLTVLGIWGGSRLLFDHSNDYTVTAEFVDAAGLTKNSSVKIGGVSGGRVKAIELTDRDTSKVTMILKDGAYPIGSGASAASRPVNLLGEKYVDLDPGNLTDPVDSGVRIPITRTSRPVELDDVLNTLQPDVRARLRILINEAGIALTGQGANFNKVIDELPSALDQTAELVASFSADNKRLGRLIEQSDRVLGAMTPARGDLQDLVESAGDTLKVTADNRRELAETVRAAPGALNQLRTTLTQLAGTADELKPFGAQLRRTAVPLTQTLKDLPDFQEKAGPALEALRSVSPKLETLGREGRSPVRRLRTTSRELAKFAADLKPVVGSFDNHAMKNMLGLMDGWSRTIAKADGLGHIFGLRIIFDRTLLTTLVDRYVGPNLPAKAKRGTARTPRPPAQVAPAASPSKPAVKAPAVQLPKTGVDVIDKTLEGVGKIVDRVVPKAVGTVTETLDALTGRSKDSARVPAGGSSASDANTLYNYLVGP